MKKYLFIAVLFAGTMLAGCDELKNATSIDIKVDNVKFEFTADVVSGVSQSSALTATRADTPNSFTVTRTVDVSEVGSAQLTEYIDKVGKVVANNSLITLTANPAGTYSVSNLTVTAVGVSGSVVVPSYTMGGTFTAPANMATYTNAFLMKLVSVKKIDVTVKGNTNAPVGTEINISYESDLIFTASLF